MNAPRDEAPAAQTFEAADACDDRADSPRLRAVTAAELLTMELPPRDFVLAPWLPTQGLAMIYAPRGMGKTHLALGISHAVATGGSCLRWHAPKPRRVLHLDGEMPVIAIQERLRWIMAGSPAADIATMDNLAIIADGLQDDGMPDLATEAGRCALEPYIEGVELIVVDNISTLCRSGKENEADDWLPVQDWLRQMRRRGISVTLVHHAGKGGQQRGTSRREDILDTVIALRRPQGYRSEEGARFEVHFEKTRGSLGADVAPFEARLEIRDGAAHWAVRGLDVCEAERIAELHADGLSQREIAKELGISAATVNRQLKRGRRDAGA